MCVKKASICCNREKKTLFFRLLLKFKCIHYRYFRVVHPKPQIELENDIGTRVPEETAPKSQINEASFLSSIFLSSYVIIHYSMHSFLYVFIIYLLIVIWGKVSKRRIQSVLSEPLLITGIRIEDMGERGALLLAIVGEESVGRGKGNLFFLGLLWREEKTVGLLVSTTEFSSITELFWQFQFQQGTIDHTEDSKK